MCPRDVVDIHIPRRDDDNRLMGPPIIELKFEKDILELQIIIGEESIQLRMEKEKPTLCERCLQFRHPKKFCRSNREICRDFKKEECTIVERSFTSIAKNPTRQVTKNICREHTIEATIQNKMRLEKCDA